MTQNDQELKPCPFCGVQNKYTFVENEVLDLDPNPLYFGLCGHCGAQGPVEDTHEEALISWNQRHEGESE